MLVNYHRRPRPAFRDVILRKAGARVGPRALAGPRAQAGAGNQAQTSKSAVGYQAGLTRVEQVLDLSEGERAANPPPPPLHASSYGLFVDFITK